MLARYKLKKYLEEKGIQHKWFAEKIGMRPSYLYAILAGRRKVPKKYWKAIILITNHTFTVEDFLDEPIE